MPPPENADGIGGVIPAARLASSIGCAVNTATADAPAVDKLSGSLDRMVHDSSRKVVEYNAEREGVRYLRHAAPGACEWCRLMAIRGPVFKSECGHLTWPHFGRRSA
jgi:hypothetical protein